jgi:hypothetical protein
MEGSCYLLDVQWLRSSSTRGTLSPHTLDLAPLQPVHPVCEGRAGRLYTTSPSHRRTDPRQIVKSRSGTGRREDNSRQNGRGAKIVAGVDADKEMSDRT